MVWKCDTCGDAVETVETGWVEWMSQIGSKSTNPRHNFRLVHHAVPGKKCQYNSRTFPEGTGLGDLPLAYFLGNDGLMNLLEYLSDSPSSADEIIELIKRLHIPGYEEARSHFDHAIRAGVFEPNTKPGFYSLADIQRTVDWAKKLSD